MALCARLLDALANARARRLDRAITRLSSEPTEQVIQSYAPVLRLAARLRPEQALALFERHDATVPPERYPLNESFVAGLISAGDRCRLVLAMKVAHRLQLEPEWKRAARALAIDYARRRDDDALVIHLDDWKRRGTLERGVVEEVFTIALAAPDAALSPAWRGFLSSLDGASYPDVSGAPAAVRTERLKKLGRGFEALAICPADEIALLLDLIRACADQIDAHVRSARYEEAVEGVCALTDKLRAAQAAELDRARADAASQREAVLAAMRSALRDTKDLIAWSQLEERAGELQAAARIAVDAGDPYRAHRLFMRADLPGEARRVLSVLAGDARTQQVDVLEAEASERGGDFAGAAQSYERAGRLDAASAAYEKAGQLSSAARCLRALLGEEEAIESARFVRLMEGSGAVEELAGLLVGAVRKNGRHGNAAPALYRLVESEAGASITVGLAREARTLLEGLHVEHKRAFDRGVARWIDRARATIEARYAATWGLDLGTTKCSVAVFDREKRRPEICRYKGRDQFASTLAVDVQGYERVGLTHEELFAPDIVGAVSASKRKMGSSASYKLGGKSYRPEEIAARLIEHARGVVEDFLRQKVRAELKSLALAEVGQLREEWLDEIEREHDLTMRRTRAVVTIPAFFRNNQKHGTRDACEIAGVEPVRLIHEPTAACLAMGVSERLQGRCAVVDLGAGTLDLSAVEISEGLYEVHRVHGDTEFGGNDFDAAVTRRLEAKIAHAQRTVQMNRLTKKRLEVAAEQMKIELSAAAHARYTLRGFAEGGDLDLELSREELALELKTSLEHLENTCRLFATELSERPGVLLLVGGPMLSSLVVERVEAAFQMKARRALDPRTVVAAGAAVQGAILDGVLEDKLVLDVAPLALGIRTVDAEDKHLFSELIPKNHRIPVSRSRVYTTRQDLQTSVDIEIFQGDLDPEGKIGQFILDGIPPAKKGVPQIAVSFAIDASCVLEVAAKDLGTGKTQTVRISDTTLVSPPERERMRARLAAHGDKSERRRELDALQTKLGEMADEAKDLDLVRLHREWVGRRDAFHPAQAAPQPDESSVLAEMFQRASSVESEIHAVALPLGDMLAAARRFVEEHATSEEEVSALLDRGRAQQRRLGDSLERVRAIRRTLIEWNAVLTRIATRDADPRKRFVALHDAKDYRRALQAHALIEARADEPLAEDELRRQLDCLGHVGDVEAYRALAELRATAIGASPIEWSKLDRFCAVARPRIAWIKVADGVHRWTGSGFLIGERWVATNQHVVVRELVGDRARIPREAIGVHLDGAWREVESVLLPGSHRVDVALLRLKDRVDPRPFRLGYSELARLGQSVVAIGFPLANEERTFDENIEVQAGVLNKFEVLPDVNVRLFKVQIAINPGMSGGPLFNDLGEVIGLTTMSRIQVLSGSSAGVPARIAESSFALAVDPLRDLLAAAES